MSNDHGDRDREVPLPEFAGTDEPTDRRVDGVRRSRRISNWTAATLLVGAGAAALGLAHQAVSGSAATNSPQVGHSVATSSGSQAAHSTTAPGSSHATKAPKVSNPVTTTSGSGVTTTTRTVNGKTVVVKTHHSDDD